MKKKIITALCICTLGLGMTVSVSAANSPSNKPVKEKTQAPETGEANVVGMSFGALALLGGAAVVSRKKMAE